MVKKKRHKAFWSNIKFKYKLTIINENTLEEVVGLRDIQVKRHLGITFCADCFVSGCLSYHCFHSVAQLLAGIHEQ